MRILLADDRSSVRSALRLLLEDEQDLTVVGEASDESELIAMLDTKSPDVILLDWELPGLAASTILANSMKSWQVIVLSSRPEVQRLALAAGADAFVSKGDTPETLLEAIRSLRHQAE